MDLKKGAKNLTAVVSCKLIVLRKAVVAEAVIGPCAERDVNFFTTVRRVGTHKTSSRT